MNDKVFSSAVIVSISIKILLGVSITLEIPILTFGIVKLLDRFFELVVFYCIAKDCKKDYSKTPVFIYTYIFISIIESSLPFLARQFFVDISPVLVVLRFLSLLVFIAICIQLYNTRYVTFIVFSVASYIAMAIIPILLSVSVQRANIQFYQAVQLCSIVPMIALYRTIRQRSNHNKQLEKDIASIGEGIDE